MKTKWFSFLALVALSLCAILKWQTIWKWTCRSYAPSSKLSATNTVELRQTLQKCSSEPEIQREVDSLFSRFGDKGTKPIYGEVLSTTPALARFARTLSDDTDLEIVPNGYFEKGVPIHMRLRFGTHSHYQFILIFRTGSDLSSIKPPLEQVVNNVYFRP